MFCYLIIDLNVLALADTASAQNCVECHKEVTPHIVQDWILSAHSDNDVDCSTCHGDGQESADDVAEMLTVTAETCGQRHEDRIIQCKSGKHVLAWAAMKAMPTTHHKPMELIEDMKGCSGYPKIGMKTEAEIAELKQDGSGFGFASCNACHTLLTFPVAEVRDPQACATYHMPDQADVSRLPPMPSTQDVQRWSPNAEDVTPRTSPAVSWRRANG